MHARPEGQLVPQGTTGHIRPPLRPDLGYRCPARLRRLSPLATPGWPQPTRTRHRADKPQPHHGRVAPMPYTTSVAAAAGDSASLPFRSLSHLQPRDEKGSCACPTLSWAGRDDGVARSWPGVTPPRVRQHLPIVRGVRINAAATRLQSGPPTWPQLLAL